VLPTTGALAAGCFVVVLVSGAFLALHFDATRPRSTVEAIQEVVPLGFVVRGLHRFAADLFLILVVLHTAARLGAGDYRRLRTRAWVAGACILPVVVWLMFSGFLLRGDVEARAAGEITRHLLALLPDHGRTRVLLLGTSADGLYVGHAATFVILVLALILVHARFTWPTPLALALPTTAALAIAAVVNAPLAPESVAVVKGPWYLLGLQEALAHTCHPLLPFLPPLLLFLYLLFLPRLPDRWLRPVGLIVILPYLLLTAVAWLR